jgi:hypothetical protein
MYRPSLPLVLLMTVIAALPSAAQTPVRDPRAIAVVQEAVMALGGFTAVGQIMDATVTGTILPANRSNLTAGMFRWEDAPPEFRYTLQTAAETRVFASGHGRPAYINKGVVHSLMPHMASASMPFHLPALVLAKWVNNPDASIQLASSGALAGTAAVHVHISLNTDSVSSEVTSEDWYIDPATGLPLRVEYRLPDNRRPEDFSVEAEEFSNFQVVNGVHIPWQITIYRDGVLQGVGTVNSAVFNTGLSSSEFDLLQEVQQ